MGSQNTRPESKHSPKNPIDAREMWISSISALHWVHDEREDGIEIPRRYYSEEIVEIRQSLVVRASTSFFDLCNPSIDAGTALDATSTLLKFALLASMFLIIVSSTVTSHVYQTAQLLRVRI